MFSQILSNTPKWVFVLFFALLALGISQMRRSTKSRNRVLIMPIVFLVLSIAGVISAFGIAAMPLTAWAVGYIALVSLMGRGFPSSGNGYNPETKRFTIEGSAVPLGLMMGIFFLKYFVGASMGMHAGFTNDVAFPIVVSLLYGAFSGVFAGRAWRLIKLSRAS
jgi:hypothetical protein